MTRPSSEPAALVASSARSLLVPPAARYRGLRALRPSLAILLAATLPLAACDAPGERPIAARSPDAVFTANEKGASVSGFNSETGDIRTVPVSISPHNVEASADGRFIFAVGSPVSGHGGQGGHDHSADAPPGRLLVLAANDLGRGPLAEIQVGRGPAHVVADSKGTRAFVTNSIDRSLSVVDLARGTTIGSVPLGASPHGLRLGPGGRTLYIANTGDGTVSIVDTARLVETARVSVGKAPVQVAVTPDGRRTYVSLRGENEVAVLDNQTRRVVGKISVGSGPIQLFVSPDGKEVFVANQGTEAAPGTTLTVIDVGRGETIAEIPTGAGAHGVSVSADGQRVYVANSFAHTVAVVDPAARRVLRTIRTGAGPGGITHVSLAPRRQTGQATQPAS